MIRVTVQMSSGDTLQKLYDALGPDGIDQVADKVALKTLAELVQNTPQRWFGQVRKSWQVQTPRTGARLVVNDNKIMWFLEYGTKDHGPVSAKALFIPLTRAAAMGYQRGMRFGQDFVMAKRVRGITPRLIAQQQAAKTEQYMLDEMKNHIREAIAA